MVYYMLWIWHLVGFTRCRNLFFVLWVRIFKFKMYCDIVKANLTFNLFYKYFELILMKLWCAFILVAYYLSLLCQMYIWYEYNELCMVWLKVDFVLTYFMVLEVIFLPEEYIYLSINLFCYSIQFNSNSFIQYFHIYIYIDKAHE